MGDVSVRVLEWIYQKYPNQNIDFSKIKQECVALYEECKNLDPILQVGEKQSDEEIVEWIAQVYLTHPGIRRSTAHAKLRKEGKACSTNRFKNF